MNSNDRPPSLWPCGLFFLATLVFNASIRAIVSYFDDRVAEMVAGGVMIGEGCIAVVFCGLWGRHWLAGYAAATALATAGVLSLVGSWLGYSVWIGEDTFRWQNPSLYPLFHIPPLVLLSSLTLIAFRVFRGWSFSQQAKAPARSKLSIGDLIVCTAIVAAVLMFSRSAIQVTEMRVDTYWPPIAMIATTFCIAGPIAIAPTAWILFRVQHRRAIKLTALVVVECLIAGGVIVAISELRRPALPASVTFALTVLCVAVAFVYAIIGLIVLRRAGFRLHTRFEENATSSVPAETTLQRWAAPVGVLGCFLFMQLLFAGMDVYSETKIARGRQLQREWQDRGGRVVVDEYGDVFGIALSPKASRDDIIRLLEYPKLQRVTLAEMAFTDTDLQLLKPLKKLEWIDLSRTSITDAALNELADWKAVNSLSIAGTKCTAAGIRKFVEGRPLRMLDIGYLNLNDAEVQAIASSINPLFHNSGGMKLKGAIRLVLSGNPITNDACQFLAGTGHLWGLDLTDCDVDEGCLRSNTFSDLILDGTRFDITFARQAKTLNIYKSLSMDRTGVIDAVLPSFSRSSQMDLKLGETLITENGLSGLGLNGPSSLSLNSRKFTGACFEKWKPNLSILDLSHSGVTDAEIKHIVQLPRLYNLSLANTDVSDACLDMLEQSNIRIINLSATRITAAGLLRRNWKTKDISIAVDQFTEQEIKVLLKHGSFKIVPPVVKDVGKASQSGYEPFYHGAF